MKWRKGEGTGYMDIGYEMEVEGEGAGYMDIAPGVLRSKAHTRQCLHENLTISIAHRVISASLKYQMNNTLLSALLYTGTISSFVFSLSISGDTKHPHSYIQR